MTTPMQPAVQQVPAGTRLPNGYLAMGGGYEPNMSQQGLPQQQPVQQQTQLGQPTPQNFTQPQLPPQQGWQPPFQPPLPPLQQSQQQPGQWAPQTGALPPMNTGQQTWQPPGQQPPVPLFPAPAVLPQQQQGAWPSLTDRLPQGPGIPPELQGRTIGEVVAIANGLRQVHLQNMTQQQPGNMQSPPPLNQQQSQQQPQQGQPFDWRNPAPAMTDAARTAVREVMQQEIMPLMQPVVQNNMMQQARSARDQVANEIGPRFAELEPLVIQNLRGIDPRALLTPDAWRVAAQVAAGQKALAPQQPQQSYQHAPGGYPVQQMNQIQNPLPNLNTFWSEQPNQGGRGPQGIVLTAQQMGAADAMQMPYADYAAWLGGGR